MDVSESKKDITIVTGPGDVITIKSENITTVITHNEVGISVNHQREGEKASYREERIWFKD
jgi:hypothetical protein